MPLEEFRGSKPLTLGVELELQLLSAQDFDLSRAAPDLMHYLSRRKHAGDVKPEITESMIEVSTDVQSEFSALIAELRQIRNDLLKAAGALNVGISGGGAHPFQHWPDRSIYESPRFKVVSELYGYLAKQFTVFGQHVHVGCADGDQALYLLHLLSRYVPHFIALSASSPFAQGTETLFDCSRLNSVLVFPLSGRAPCLLKWADFTAYFEKMEALRIVKSMKDFYWDIRPKPAFGTVEVRVCDTPLTVERAGVLAAYIQALSKYLLDTLPGTPREDDYLVYGYNRFSACRFGLGAVYIDPLTGSHLPLRDHISYTLEKIAPYAVALGSRPMVDYLSDMLEGAGNDASWIRAKHRTLR
ncbi:MAG: glutamate--cysteine ligase, partial [Thermoleophilia bacterium]|nr:glutamate--cysteine ligase [Thermoleophilia bacterium]